MVKFFNSITRKKEVFRPIHKRYVGLYTCGPTVYNYAHIGNYRTYIFEDILRRTLEYVGYKVKHVMNITDVGHLVSDADLGEDKIEKEAKKEGKTVWEIATFYTQEFLKGIQLLNIKKAQILSPATKNIPEQIKIIQILLKKGYAYETSQAIYFDTAKFKHYTKLSGQQVNQKLTGVREEVVVDKEKKHPQDFSLWFKLVGHFKHHIMRWDSPWGPGFPGWHIECSAISTKYLGQPFDIHAGGIDHIPVHHTNEIAQSEAAFEKALARVWMHGEFLLIDNSRMGKSAGNFLTLTSVIEKEFNPLAFRYFTLTAHYRSKLNFTFTALEGAQNSLFHLYDFVREIQEDRRKDLKTSRAQVIKGRMIQRYQDKFEKAIFDDLNLPKALGIIWELINLYHKKKESFDPKGVLDFLYQVDTVLGLNLNKVKKQEAPPKIMRLVSQRDQARKNKDWKKADEIRNEVEKTGYQIEDTSEGTRVIKTI